MKASIKDQNMDCRIDDISAFIDGELCDAEQAAFYLHIERCVQCSIELTRQKQFLRELEIGLMNEKEIDLPSDFTKLVVANAESSITGIRRPTEIYNALMISAGLLLIVIVSMGGDVSKAPQWGAVIFESLYAFINVVFSLIYSVLLGLNIIVRGLASQIHSESVAPLSLFLFAVSVTFLMYRRLIRHLRVQA